MKVLVFRNGRMGDVIMTLPALGWLLSTYPDAEVHVLTSRDGWRVLRGFDARVSRIHVYRGLRPFRDLRVHRLLVEERYDRIYCLESHPCYARLFSAAGGDVRTMTETAGHGAERYLRVIAQGQPPSLERQSGYLRVSADGQQGASTLLRQLGVRPDTVLIGFHPTCSSSRKPFLRGRKTRKNKEWPAEHFARLADSLLEVAAARGLDMKIVMDLLPEEREYGERIVKESRGRVLLQTPTPDFERYKAVLARMDVLITPDTGPMHLAAALGTRLVALFSGKDPMHCGPFAPEHQYRVLRAEDMPHGHSGIAAIPPACVLAAVCELLG